GDIFHHQEEEAGKYNIAGRTGHLNLRAMNMKIPGLHAAVVHDKQVYLEKDEKPIQERDPKKILFLDGAYLHATHLPRTSYLEKEKEVPLRAQKRKYELGIRMPKDFPYPEVFYMERPDLVPNPWLKMSNIELLRGAVQTPLKWLKRRLI
ncbi:MAG: hypothetical protein Q8P10_01995, partial [bacterium]|nr:hypothetical protein [bacterium]